MSAEIVTTDKISAEASPWIKTTCAYCGVGCGIEARKNRDGNIEIRGDESHPANYGLLCSKGLALADTLIPDGRLLYPTVEGNRVTWDQAIAKVASGFQSVIERYGPDAVAFYVSGQLLTEDYYVANKLMKGFIGSANIDTNSRLCMSSSVAGHKRAFGSDTVPGCYEDLELADLVILTGSNLAWCHPVLFQRLRAAKVAQPKMRIVVIDPRRTDSCDIADIHLAVQPGSDVALFNGLLAYLDNNHGLNQAYIDDYTQGFGDALKSAQGDYRDLTAIAGIVGVDRYLLETFYRWFLQIDNTVTIYSQGVNQSSAGTDKVNSIINCHLATGRIGRPGQGPFSVTGQPNAMGGREVGGLANMLAAHLEFDNADHYQALSNFWQTENLAKQPGLKAVDLFNAVDNGSIKAIWIMATNPVVSMPDANRVKAALEKCELVVVSDCIADTDTGRLANVLLPAKGWGEKAGTVTNSERRISRQRALVEVSGEARSDWKIICDVAKKMGYPSESFDYKNEAEIFTEFARQTLLAGNDFKLASNKNIGTDKSAVKEIHYQPIRDLQLGALATLTESAFEQLSPQQWPLPDGLDEGIRQKRFFAEGNFFTSSGKANFVAVNYRPPNSQVSGQFPLILNTGRIRDQWHTMTRTGLAAKLCNHIPEPFVAANALDIKSLGLTTGTLVELVSEVGSATVRLQCQDYVPPGQLFMPMHWTGSFASEARIGALVTPEVDPVSGQPESKFTPVQLRSWEYQCEALLLVKQPLASLAAWPYWVMQRIEGGFLYRLASNEPAKQQLLALKSYCQSLSNGQWLSFDDANKRSFRGALLQDSSLIACFIVAESIRWSEFDWLEGLLIREADNVVKKALLTGKADKTLTQGPLVCACKQIGAVTISNAIREHNLNSVEAVSEVTCAGTGCGSCIPELRQLLDDNWALVP